MAGESIACPACEVTIDIPSPPKPKVATGQGGKKRMVMKKRTSAPSRPQASAPRAAERANKPSTSKQAPAPAPAADAASPKSRTVALLLCLFVGSLSVHRFYAGKIGTAILQILTMGGLGIWLTIDLIMIICGAFKDKEGLPLRRW